MSKRNEECRNQSPGRRGPKGDAEDVTDFEEQKGDSLGNEDLIK